MKNIIYLTAISAFAMGCGAETSGSSSSSYAEQTSVDAGVQDDANELRDAETPVDNNPFIGHWAHRQVLAGFTDLPVFRATYSETVGTFKLDIIPDEDVVLVLM